MPQDITPEQARRELERRRQRREGRITPEQARRELERRRVSEAQVPEPLFDAPVGTGPRMTTAYDPVSKELVSLPEDLRGASYIGSRRVEDVARSAGGAIQRGLVAAPQIVPATINLAGRVLPGLYGEEGYEDPLITREEWLQGARDLGVLAEQPYEPGTGLARVVSGGSEALAEGGGLAGGIRGGARAAGRRIGGREMRDIAEEAVTSGVAGAGIQTGAEITGEPNALSVIGGLAAGAAAGRVMMSNSRGRDMIRNATTNYPDEVFEAADQVMVRAARDGVPVGADEALMQAAQSAGYDISALQRLSGEARASLSAGGASMRQQEVMRSAMGGPLDEYVGGLTRGVDEDAPYRAQSVAGSVLSDLADERTAMTQPYYAETAAQRLTETGQPVMQVPSDVPAGAPALLREVREGEALLSSTRRQLQEIVDTSPSRDAREAAADALEGLSLPSGQPIETIDDMASWLVEQRQALNARSGRAQRSLGQIFGQIDDDLRLISPEYRGAQENFEQISRAINNPMERALGAIANPRELENARSVYQWLSTGGRAGGANELRQGFGAIANADTGTARQLQQWFVREAMTSAANNVPPTQRPSELGQALFGSIMQGENGQAMRVMNDVLDEISNLPQGTTQSAWENAMQSLSTVALRPTGAVQSSVEQAGRARGAAAVGQGLLKGMSAPNQMVNRIVQGRSYDEIARAFADPRNTRYIRELARTDPNVYRARYLTMLIMGMRPEDINPAQFREEQELRERQQRREAMAESAASRTGPF